MASRLVRANAVTVGDVPDGKGLLLALGIAFAATGSVQAVRWCLRPRASQPGPDG